MDIIKEQSKYNGKCVIRTNCYASTFDHFEMLVGIAKTDFPELISNDIEIVQYGGQRYKRTFGIEFSPTNYVSSSYVEIENLEYRL